MNIHQKQYQIDQQRRLEMMRQSNHEQIASQLKSDLAADGKDAQPRKVGIVKSIATMLQTLPRV